MDIDFRFLVEDELMVVNDQLDREKLTQALSRHSSCCGFQGGFVFLQGGKAINEDAIDELRMTQTWMTAVALLLAGSPCQQVWAWEESSQTLIRRGDRVLMFDVHHTGQVIMPRIELDLGDFARHLGQLALTLHHLFMDLIERAPPYAKATFEEQLPTNWDMLCKPLIKAELRPVADSPNVPSEPLIHLWFNEQTQALNWLKAHPAERNRLYQGMCLLGHACARRLYSWVPSLMDAGVPVGSDAYEGYRRSPIGVLVTSPSPEATDALDALLNAGADPDPDEMPRPILTAAWSAIYSQDGTPSANYQRLIDAGVQPDRCCALLTGSLSLVGEQPIADDEQDDLVRCLVARLRNEHERQPNGTSARWQPVAHKLMRAGLSVEKIRSRLAGRPRLLALFAGQ